MQRPDLGRRSPQSAGQSRPFLWTTRTCRSSKTCSKASWRIRSPRLRAGPKQRTGGALGSGLVSDDDLELMHAYWRDANYLSVGQIYLLDNPLLREPLR